MPRVPCPTQCVCPRVSHTGCPSHMFGQMGPGLGGKMHNLTENIKWGGNLRTETRIEAPQSEKKNKNTKNPRLVLALQSRPPNPLYHEINHFSDISHEM